jgi:hypothetical protein
MDYKKALPLIVCLLIAGSIVVFKYSARAPEQVSSSTDHTILIQGTLNIPVLTQLKSAIIPKINVIFEEAFDMDLVSGYKPGTCDYYFTPKKEQLLTLYYVEDIASDADAAMIMEESARIASNNQPACMLKNTTLTYDVRFFGDEFDELVIMAHDQSHELATLNTLFKDAFHTLNNSNRARYNVEKSERHGYHPHVSLGKIDLARIKFGPLLDIKYANDVIDRIRRSIIEETLRALKEITHGQPIPISFETVRIVDTDNHNVKEIPLR